MNALTVLERCRAGFAEIEQMETAIATREDVRARCAAYGDEQQAAALDGELAALYSTLEVRRRAHAAELCAGVWILDMLPSAERAIMNGWYMQRSSMPEIARQLNYSLSTAKRYRTSAMQRCADMTGTDMAGFLPDWYDRYENGAVSK